MSNRARNELETLVTYKCDNTSAFADMFSDDVAEMMTEYCQTFGSRAAEIAQDIHRAISSDRSLPLLVFTEEEATQIHWIWRNAMDIRKSHFLKFRRSDSEAFDCILDSLQSLGTHAAILESEYLRSTYDIGFHVKKSYVLELLDKLIEVSSNLASVVVTADDYE